jgi:NAD+ synthase (glutamine-hydrolysing)
MLIAVGQINTTVGDMRGNTEKMAEFAHRAYQRGAQLIVFPELAVCGYAPRDLCAMQQFPGRQSVSVN